jgi:hypothetical protein
VITVRFPEPHADRLIGRARADVDGACRGARRASGRIGGVVDVAWTLLVLLSVGAGIVVLRLLLGLARGVIGH